MAGNSKQPCEEGHEDAPCLVTSQDADGSVRSIGPFSRERAEALVQVYGRMYPKQTCWIEPLPKEIQSLQTGRVQRHRGAPTLASHDRNH